MTPQGLAFVRREMLPELAPPPREKGIGKWARANLFNSWTSATLTILSVLAVLWMVKAAMPWLLNSVWNAKSLDECRQILAGAEGACWGVIRERWTQLIFGFYPPDQYWRPILALLLLFVALAPILLPKVTRKALVFTALFPGIAYWLIWGGSLWGPLSAYAGLALGALLLRWTGRFGVGLSLAIGIGGALLWWLVASGPVASALSDAVPLSLSKITSRELGGFLLSTVIGATGIALSLPIGIVLALGRRSNMPLLKISSVTVIEFIRGVPLITLLFTASLLLNYFLPPGTNFDLVLRVIIMVTLFESAYMAEVIRGGLAAIPRGQYEAGDSLGLNYWQSTWLIVMPQALKISIPSIVGLFISLFKGTTLVIFIGLLDPVALSNSIRSTTAWQGVYWELFIFVGTIFFLFCFGMSRYSMWLEHRLKTDHR